MVKTLVALEAVKCVGDIAKCPVLEKWSLQP